MCVLLNYKYVLFIVLLFIYAWKFNIQFPHFKIFSVFLQIFLCCIGHPDRVGGPKWPGAAPSLIVLLWPLS